MKASMVEVLAGFALLACFPIAFGLLGVWVRRARGASVWKVRLPVIVMGLIATVVLAVGSFNATADPIQERLYFASPLVLFLAGLVFGRPRASRAI